MTDSQTGARPPAPNLNTHPQEYTAAGVSTLLFIFSFFVYNGVSLGGATFGWNAWSNFLTLLATLFNLAVLVACAVYLFTPHRLPTIDRNKLGPWTQLSLVSGINLFLVLVRLIWVAADRADNGDPQWAMYATIIGLISLVFLLSRIARRTGETKPELRQGS